MLTSKIDGSLPGVIGVSERDIKVAAAGIDARVAQTGSDDLDRLPAVVKILTQGMLERMG